MEEPLLRASYEKLTLIVIVSMLAAARDDADQRLITEFYNRLRAKFFDRCHKITQKLYGERQDWQMTRDEVFQETFILVLEKIRKGLFKGKDTWDDNECEKVILYWMSSTVNKKLLRILKDDKKVRKRLEQYNYEMLLEHADGEIGVRKNYTPTYDKVKLHKVWTKLNPMSKDIILLCIDNGTVADENTNHLPDEIISHLTKTYNVKSPAIRKAKERALKELKSCKLDQTT